MKRTKIWKCNLCESSPFRDYWRSTPLLLDLRSPPASPSPSYRRSFWRSPFKSHIKYCMFWNLIFFPGRLHWDKHVDHPRGCSLPRTFHGDQRSNKQAGKPLNSTGATDGSDLWLLYFSLGSTTSVHLSLFPSSRLLSPAPLPRRESEHWGALAENGPLKLLNHN